MRRGRTWTGLGLGLLLTLGACGGEAAAPEADAAAGGGAASEGGAASQAAAAPEGGDTEGLQVAYASDLDPTDIADQIGVQAAGAEVTALTEDSAVVAGLTRGDFQIGNIDVTAAIKAIQGGVPLKIVYVAQNTPEFVMVTQPDITEFSQLEGQQLAYHSPGSLTEILQRELVRQNVPELEESIQWTVLPESPNRATAMVAERIDGTTLEFLDVVALQEQGEFNVLGSWGDLEGESADALATAWVVTDEYLTSDRATVVEFLGHIQDGYDTFYEDKEGWLTLATELIPDVDEGALEQAYDYYTEVGMYPTGDTPPITEERWAGLDAFFRQIGEYEQEAPLDMVALDVIAEVAER